MPTVSVPGLVARSGAIENGLVRGFRGFGERGQYAETGRLVVVVVGGGGGGGAVGAAVGGVEEGFAETGIVRNAGCLALDELSQKGEFDVVGHDVGGTLDVSALHEELEVGHDLVLELLEPLVELHVVLVGDGIIVLPSTGLAPVGLGQLQCVVDLGVEGAVPLCGLLVEQDSEDAGLDAELDEGAAIGVWEGEDALLALVAAGGASGDVSEFWPGEVVGKHGGFRGKNELRECI